jgi:hypothetical protein
MPQSSAAIQRIKMANAKKFKIPDDRISLIQSGIDQVYQKMRLTPGVNAEDLNGSRTLAESSRQNYLGKLKCLRYQNYAYDHNLIFKRYFLHLIEDYESMVILENIAPQGFCPAINPKSMALCVKWKRSRPGTILRRRDNGDNSDETDIVKDYNGNPILCCGDWMGNTVQQFQAAISGLHCARNNSGAYVEKCSNCHDSFHDLPADEKRQFRGCYHHAANGEASVWRRGDPTKSVDWLNAHKWSTRTEQNEVPSVGKGASQINPMDVVKLRSTSQSYLLTFTLRFYSMPAVFK